MAWSTWWGGPILPWQRSVQLFRGVEIFLGSQLCQPSASADVPGVLFDPGNLWRPWVRAYGVSW
jgi:hypothetical protein